MKLMALTTIKMLLVIVGCYVEPRRNRVKTKKEKMILPRRVPMVDHDNTYNDDIKVSLTFWHGNMIRGGLL